MEMHNNPLRLILVAGLLFLTACAQTGAKGFPPGVDLKEYHKHGYPIPTSFPVPSYPESVAVDYWGGGKTNYMTFASMATPVQVTQWYEALYRTKGAKFYQTCGSDAKYSLTAN